MANEHGKRGPCKREIPCRDVARTHCKRRRVTATAIKTDLGIYAWRAPTAAQAAYARWPVVLSRIHLQLHYPRDATAGECRASLPYAFFPVTNDVLSGPQPHQTVI